MSDKTEADRLDSVRELLEFSQPLEKIAARLSGFGWDYEGGGVEMTRAHLSAVLQRFLLGELSATDVEDWANLIEMREDVHFRFGGVSKVEDAIFQLANPVLHGAIDRESTTRLLEDLLLA